MGVLNEVPHEPSGFGFILEKIMSRAIHMKLVHAPKMFALMYHRLGENMKVMIFTVILIIL